MAASAAAAWPGSSPPPKGRATIRIPAKPASAATIRPLVNPSPSTRGAASATQSGEVNSMAKTCDSGMAVIAQNQRFWPAKCATLRARCSGRRRARTSRARPSARTAALTTARPSTER